MTARTLRSWLPPALTLALLLGTATLPREDVSGAEEKQARQILDSAGVQGGFVVHLGCGDGRLTAALRASDSYIVHGLDTEVDHVARARAHIRQQGLYGQVSVDQLDGSRLPYVDNLVNLLVSENLGDVSADEMLRVLAPQGVAYIKRGDTWTRTVKPRPDEIDQWTHYMHDASGNAVAHDSVVGPPRHLQWIGNPRWSRHHDRMASLSALVASGGRIFYIMDEGSRVSIQLPPKWTLIARDAFNGTILWKQQIPTWHNHLWPLKSGPTQLARRLICMGDTVYVTLGLEAPLTALDAATGRMLRSYEGTQSTEEVIGAEGVLFVLVNKGPSLLSTYAPLNNVGDQQRVSNEWHWDEKPRQVMAVEADTGRVLWSKESVVSPITLAAAGNRVFFHDGEKVVCLDRSSGQEVWNSPSAKRRALINFNFGPKLVVYQDVVLYAGGDRTMRAFSIDSGKQLWEAPHGQSGYASPEDLLVADGLVWNAPTTSGNLSGVYTGRDPKTGEVKREFPPDVETYWFHHRCYMAKATDRFLLPSRTGIEFIDHQKEHWDINHWVRGGCLYGIMPCNGMIYAPPHDCACYPEAKLYGLNALAPASAARRPPKNVSDKGRLLRGAAYGETQFPKSENPDTNDWPTFRHDTARSGFTRQKISTELKPSWKKSLGGTLSAVVVADGRLFVAQVDAHAVCALEADSGKVLWSYTTGGRVDSPPTIYEGRALFGSADGYVYCVRAADGELIWRFRAAPQDRRLMAFEQLESVWPVHGNVLVQDGLAYFVAGRSNFLDGGMRWFKLNAQTGQMLAEVVLDENDPESGENLQARLQILNMPVGLPDVLSGDGRYVYMRSQRFDLDGNRQVVGPHSGDPGGQGSVQAGEGAHLFAPNGFLDSTYFHRAYWVFGRSFAGGHAGYYQAGKYAPSGRLLVHDDSNVYGFGRKPQYLRWTTTLEHQLFAASKEPPAVSQQAVRRGAAGPIIEFEKSKSLDPTGKPLAVEAWIKAERPNGVVLSQGGPTRGMALVVQDGKPRFIVRNNQQVAFVAAKEDVGDKWTHLVGALTRDEQLQIYVNGKLAGTNKSSGLLTAEPAQALQIGGDEGGSVGDYKTPFTFWGLIDEVRLYHGTLSADDVAGRYSNPGQPTPRGATLVLACSFDTGEAVDESGHKNKGTAGNTLAVEGKVGRAVRFTSQEGRSGGSLVKPYWTQDVPLLVQAMVLAEKTLFIAGPADLVDEEETFLRLTNRDDEVQAQLARQDAALGGELGGLLLAVSTSDGSTLAKYQLESLPAWDGLAVANGNLYLSTADGEVLCFAGE